MGYRETADIVVAFGLVVILIYLVFGICMHKETDTYQTTSNKHTTLELPTDYPGAAILYSSTKSYTISMARYNFANKGRYNTRM